MKEASLVKFYFAKYFFLAFGIMQWLICLLFVMNYSQTAKGQWAAFVFFTLGLVLITIQLVFASQIKRVAIGKKKVAVVTNGRVYRYEWEDVKSIRFIPMFNLYRMKLKGKKKRIYFLPCEESEVIFGLFPSTVAIRRAR